jgi:hypothetical protein
MPKYFAAVGDGFPRDNGGYVLRSKTSTGCIVEREYTPIGIDMLACTFPLNQLNALSGSDFVKKYESKYNLLYLPRNLYNLLYVLYLSSQAHEKETTPALNKSFEVFDMRLTIPGIKAMEVWTSFHDLVVKHACHFARFNAFAVAMMTRLGSSDTDAVVPWAESGVIELTDEGVTPLTNFIIGRLKVALVSGPGQRFDFIDLSNPRVCRRITYLIRLENLNPRLTFLTRFGTSDVYPTSKPKDTGVLEATSFSQSFGSGLFEGVLGDFYASTITSLDKDDVFAVPIDMAAYRKGEGVAGDFFIPPIPVTIQVHAQQQELWHARSRVYPVQGKKLDEQSVGGVTEYGLYQQNPSMKALSVLHVRGGELAEKEILQRSTNFNAYVQTHKIAL